MDVSNSVAMERGRGEHAPVSYRLPAAGCFGVPHTPEPVASERFERLLASCSVRPVSLVTAPAGYGKTTLLRELVRRQLSSEERTLCVWCRLGAHPVDAPALIGELARQLGHEERPPADPELLLADASQEAARRQRTILVLDDVHCVPADSAFWPAVRGLLSSLPLGMKVALGTRFKLPIRLGRLKANGGLREVYADELRMTVGEVHAAIERECDASCSRGLARLVHFRAGGWPACVALLASLVSRLGVREAEQVLGQPGLPEDVYTYIAEEVAGVLPTPTIDAMRRLALLDSFTREIGESLFGGQATDEVLELASEVGALETTGDERRQRFRFHPLFRGFLLASWESGSVRELSSARLKAARVLCALGEAEEAVDQFLLAGQAEQASQLIRELSRGLLRAGRVARLDAWLRQLDPALMLRDPALLELLAEVDFLAGRYRKAIDELDACRKLALAKGAWADSARLSLEKARCAVDLGRPSLVEACLREARSVEGGIPQHLTWLADSLAGIAHGMNGNVRAARKHLEDSLLAARAQGVDAECIATGRMSVLFVAAAIDAGAGLELSRKALELAVMSEDSALVLHMLSNKAWNLALLGQYDEAEELLVQSIELAMDQGLLCMAPYLESTLVAVEAGRGDLAAACGRLDRVVRLLEAQDSIFTLAHELHGLGGLVRLRGAPVRALGIARRSAQLASEAGLASELAAARIEEAACLASQARLAGQAEVLRQLSRYCAHQSMSGYSAQAAYHLARCHLLGNDQAAVAEPLRRALELFQDLQYLHYPIVEAHGDPSVLLFALDEGIEAVFAKYILSRAPKSVRRMLLEWLSGADEDLRARALRLVEAKAIEDPAVVEAAERHLARERLGRPSRSECRYARLRLYTLGGFMVELDGRRLDRQDWRRPRARELLRLLAAERNHAIARDVLIARFWPDAPESRAANSAYVLVNALRKTLEPDLEPNARSSFVVLDEGEYALVPGSYWIDAEEYEWLLSRGKEVLAAGDRHAAREFFLAADHIYAGDYMADDLYGDTYFAERERFRQLQQYTLRTLVELDSQDGEAQAVPHHLRRMTQLDPWNEKMWAELVKAHMVLGDPKGAREAYLQSCRALADGDEEAMPQELAKLGRSLGRKAAARSAPRVRA